MSRLSLIDGSLRGELLSELVLTGRLHEDAALHGVLTTPQIIREYTSELDYRVMTNKPHINEHLLRSGENTLEDIGIGVCPFDAIAALF